jgi:predicted neuraminidase
LEESMKRIQPNLRTMQNWTAAWLALLVMWSHQSEGAAVKSEFIFENPPFANCHASTIAETRAGLIAAWVGGSRRGAPDVAIWLSRHNGQKWSQPIQAATGMIESERIQLPCWNPVLFRPKFGPLMLYYKVGSSPSTWWGMVMTSRDEGVTWSKPKRLPKDIYGPIRSKPVELDNGNVLYPSSTEDAGWRVHMEWTRGLSGAWNRTEAINRAMDFGAIQPTILVHGANRVQILCRTKQGRITESWSQDGGLTWSRMMATDLPNPNSAIDAVMLRDGRALLVYNHSTEDSSVLNLAISRDGRAWESVLVLEEGSGDEFSYPTIIQASSGLVHITYSWKRQRIKHVIINPFQIEEGTGVVGGRL